MNTIKKIRNLLENGFSPKTILGLTDNQINVLHKRIVEQSTKLLFRKRIKQRLIN